MTRWRACPITLVEDDADPRSGVTEPGTSALVESTRKRSTPSSPRQLNPARSVRRQIVESSSWSELDVAGVQRQTRGRLDRDGDRVGISG